MYNDSDFISKLVCTWKENKQTQQGYNAGTTSGTGLFNMSDVEIDSKGVDLQQVSTSGNDDGGAPKTCESRKTKTVRTNWE